jgi:hypothetical protein
VKFEEYDLAIFIDAETILANYPLGADSETPTAVGDEAIIAVTAHGMSRSTLPRDHLHMAAPIGATLRLREFSARLGGGHFVVLYVSPDRDDETALLSEPRLMVGDVVRPLPDDADRTRPARGTTAGYFWQSRILRHGRSSFALRFMILNSNGDIEGYFSWTSVLRIGP